MLFAGGRPRGAIRTAPVTASELALCEDDEFPESVTAGARSFEKACDVLHRVGNWD